MVEGVPDQVGTGQQVAAAGPRFGEDLGPVVEVVGGIGGLAGIVEGAVAVAAVAVLARAVVGVGVGFLVALQMIPLREDDAAEAVEQGGEVAGGGMVEQAENLS